MKITQTQKILIVAIVVNFVLIGVYGFAFSIIRNQTDDIVTIFKELGQQVDRKENIDSTNAMIKKTQEDRKKLSSFFVYTDQGIEFIEIIEELGRRTGVELEFSLSSEQEPLPFGLTVSGGFTNIMHLVTLMEKSSMNINIKRVSIAQEILNGEKNTTKLWRGNIDAELNSFINNI